MCKKVWISLVVFLANIFLYAQSQAPSQSAVIDQKNWVDSVYNSLSDDERLGQLFMVAAYTDKGPEHVKEVEELIKKYNIGGLIFLSKRPMAQVNLTNHYQSLSKVPLLIGMNLQNGLGDSVSKNPRQLTLGAIADDKAVYEAGKQVSSKLRRLGVHMTFAPNVDVATIEASKSIGERTFGEDIKNVSTKSIAYMKGLHDGKVIANARLFPSYEDMPENEYKLPVYGASLSQLQDIDFFPLQQIIKDSITAIMIGHSSIPSYDKTPNRSSNLNPKLVRDVFRKEFGFEGLIFTDALNIQELNSALKPGEIDLEALLAGNDVLIFSANIPKALKKIRSAIRSKDLSASEIEKSIKKILKAKYWAGLNKTTPISTENLYQDLNSPEDYLENYKAYGKAITLIQNQKSLIPFQLLDTLTFASVSIGADANNEFQAMLSNYAGFTQHTIANKYASDTLYNDILTKVISHKVVVVGLHQLTGTEGNSYGISPNAITFIEKLKQKTNVVIVAFGNPLSYEVVGNNASFICAYEDNHYTRELVPQILFGAVKAEGVLPVSISSTLKAGFGIKTKELRRLKYNVPESVGVDSEVLKNIDKIAAEAIKTNSTPSCQVLVARKGTVIFEKSYGYMTYDSIQPVNNQTMYDVASVTKVMATIQTLMFLEGRGLLDLNKKLSYYLPELKKSNKKDMIIRDVLIHQAGLTPFIPHWTKTITYQGLNKEYYNEEKTENYPLEVAKHMFGTASLPDSVWKWSVQSDLLRKRRHQVNYDYKYSDVGYLFLKKIAEKLLNQPMEEFLYQNFYAPLGASSLTYLPLKKFPEQRIAPTEDDKDFRRQLLRGYVHDQGAAMMGGIAGHAGLFSNASDLAKVLQMNLNGGTYGGQVFLSSSTLHKFTQRQVQNNRRGLGWDKPEISNGPTIESPKTFGHTGFTGTCVWVDPEKEIVYVFLSNRIYPNAGNNNLLKQGYRARIQEQIYKAIDSYNNLNNPQ